MDVHLTPEEVVALQQVLNTYCGDLRMEIAETDNAEYRRGLRDERALLEGVIAKLQHAGASAPTGG
jgi:hypothetical protein